MIQKRKHPSQRNHQLKVIIMYLTMYSYSNHVRFIAPVTPTVKPTAVPLNKNQKNAKSSSDSDSSDENDKKPSAALANKPKVTAVPTKKPATSSDSSDSDDDKKRTKSSVKGMFYPFPFIINPSFLQLPLL